jgi:hypothetical protein
MVRHAVPVPSATSQLPGNDDVSGWNDEIGIAYYPSLACTFALRLIDATAVSMHVRTRVTNGDCTGPEMYFTLLPADSIGYDLKYEGQLVGYGTLSKGQR